MKKSILSPGLVLAVLVSFAHANVTISTGLPTSHATLWDYFYTYGATTSSGTGLVDAGSIKIAATGDATLGMDVSSTTQLTSCTGFQYQYQGLAHTFKAILQEVEDAGDYNFHSKAYGIAASWATATINFPMEQAWSGSIAWDISDLIKFNWSVNGTGDFAIKDFVCLTSGGGGEPTEPIGNGYYIFEHKPAATENYATAYDKVDADKYVFGYSFEPGSNWENPSSGGTAGVTWVDQGVGKYRKATFGEAPGSTNGYKTQGAGLGIKNNPSGESPNMSDCELGFSYYYRGAAHEFSLEFPGTICGGDADGDGSNKWGVGTVPAATNWTKKDVAYGDITLYNTWDASECKAGNAGTVDLSKVKQMAWVMGNKLSPNSTQSLMIANVVCLTGHNEEISAIVPDASITIESGTMPIIATHSMSGLTIAVQSRALHISSDRDAKVTLYGLNGKKALSGMVNAGNSVFSLMGQKPGVYYAVVQTNSHTQTIKVILK